jgi:hypothetical protein
MRRAPLAEFLLSRFTTREHAAAMVGDLIEIAPRPIAFWLAVLHTAAKFAVTPVGAVLAGAAAAWLLVRCLYPLAMTGRPAELTVLFALSGTLFGMIAACSSVRRGLFDPATATSAALCAIASVGILLHFSTLALVITTVVAELLLLGSLFHSRGRAAVGRTLAAAVCAIAASYLTWKLLVWPIAKPPNHRPSVWFPVAVQLLIPAAACSFALAWRRPKPRAQIAE